MNIHSRARTTPASRALIVERVERLGWSLEAAAAAGGISVTTVKKWRARYRQEGPGGLRDRVSRPLRSPRRTSRRLERRVCQLRKQRLSGLAIAAITGLSRSTVSRILRRKRLSRARDLEPKAPIVRYERSRPGELVHLDIKRLVRFRQVGHRIHGDRRRKSRRAGWEYVHVCIDDHSRLAYAEVLEDERSASAIAFLRRAEAWFRRHGVRIDRVMTDNGPCYRSRRFRAAVSAVGAKQIYTRPYTPKTNGKAERLIQTLLREWAYARAYDTSAERARKLNSWLTHYNHCRPHWGIAGKPPITRLHLTSNDVLTHDT